MSSFLWADMLLMLLLAIAASTTPHRSSQHWSACVLVRT